MSSGQVYFNETFENETWSSRWVQLERPGLPCSSGCLTMFNLFSLGSARRQWPWSVL